MNKYSSNRSLSLFLLLALLLVISFLSFYSYQTQVDNSVGNTVNNPLIFSRKKLRSWPILRPVNQKRLRSSSLVSELYRESQVVRSNLLLPVFITESYVPVFFNWISHVLLQDSAQLLEHLLVITMDNASSEIIKHFDIPSICLNPTDFLSQLGFLETIQRPLHQIFSTRLICFWLLSGWGFDIIHFDVDAVPVKPKFLDLFIRDGGADLVAGAGIFPNSARKVLGATVCMGTFYLKSLTKSDGVRQLFREMRSVEDYDDQRMMNEALVNMGLSWDSSEEDKMWTGWDSSNQLSVYLLPRTLVCRNECRMLNDIRGTSEDRLYVMHPNARKSGPTKISNLASMGLWNLKSTADFSSISKFNIDLIEFVKDISQKF